MDNFDYNDRNYQELVRLAGRLDEPVDAVHEVFGGPLADHVDASKVTSGLWVDQSADDRFREACRRYPRLVQLWKSARSGSRAAADRV